jgi:hypothetical protein
MPNWCNNNITITGPKHKIDAIEQAVREGKFFNHLYPMPEPLKDSDKYPADGTERPELVEEHGANDWYDWAVNKWGSKWEADVYDGSIVTKQELLGKDTGPAILEFGFDSAWSPAIGAYEHYCENNPDVQINAYYYEPGCDFMGNWCDHVDNCYQISDVTDKELRSEFREFDDLYGIIESREQYRQDLIDEGQHEQAKEWLIKHAGMEDNEADEYIKDNQQSEEVANG